MIFLIKRSLSHRSKTIILYYSFFYLLDMVLTVSLVGKTYSIGHHQTLTIVEESLPIIWLMSIFNSWWVLICILLWGFSVLLAVKAKDSHKKLIMSSLLVIGTIHLIAVSQAIRIIIRINYG